MIRAHVIKSLYTHGWVVSASFGRKSLLHYGEACLPAMLASQPVSLLRNTYVQRTERLNSSRNHIILIDNDHTSIYSRTANDSAFISSQNYTPTPLQPHSSQSIDVD